MAEVAELAMIMKRLSALEKEVAELKGGVGAFGDVVLACSNGRYRMRLRQHDDGSLMATLLIWNEETRIWAPQGTSGEGEKALARTFNDTWRPVIQLR